MSLMRSALAALAEGTRTADPESGVYRRKTGESASLTATPARTEREQTADRQMVSVVRTKDILVLAAEFEAAFGDGARPYDGDGWEAGGRSFRVRPLGPEPAWRAADNEEPPVRLRIHLKDEGPLVP